MSNDSLLALCWLVFTTGVEIEATDDGKVKWFKLGKYRVCQTQNNETGEFRYFVMAKRKLLGVTYC